MANSRRQIVALLSKLMRVWKVTRLSVLRDSRESAFFSTILQSSSKSLQVSPMAISVASFNGPKLPRNTQQSSKVPTHHEDKEIN